MQNRNTVLFVDDEKICHTLVELIIPNFTPYKLISAFNATEAIALAERYANNLLLVLTDIMLPDLNGYELYKKIKTNNKLIEVPFIFQSGLESQETELNEHAPSNVKILYKPYTQADLLKSIADVLNVDLL